MPTCAEPPAAASPEERARRSGYDEDVSREQNFAALLREIQPARDVVAGSGEEAADALAQTYRATRNHLLALPAALAGIALTEAARRLLVEAICGAVTLLDAATRTVVDEELFALADDEGARR
jgi:hypothetical protein